MGFASIYRNELEALLPRLCVTEEYKAEIFSAYDKITSIDEARNILISVITEYKDRGTIDYTTLVDKLMPRMEELTGMHRYRVNMATIFPLLPYSKTFYEKAGVSENVWLDSIYDFVCKLIDCKRINGFIGLRSSSLNWFRGWLFAEKFAFHRLQFEIVYVKDDYKSENFDIKAGDPTISIHIPSDLHGIPFSKENREISYGLAKEYFLPKIGDKPFILRCASWLLAPFHKEILPKESNTRQFTEEFELVSSTSGRWALPLVFNTENLPADKDLPENTSLQRAYKKLILSGVEPLNTLGYRKY